MVETETKITVEEESTTIKNIEKKTYIPEDLKENVIKYYEYRQMGVSCPKARQSIKHCIINNITHFKVYKAQTPFDRRVTFLVWHPTNPRVIAVASKGGDIILWDYEKPIDIHGMIKGIGAGGSIQAMKFDSVDPGQIYTVSIEGKFLLLNFQTKQAQEFLDTQDFKKWYVSFDVNASGKTMVAGDNHGYLTFLTTSGEVIWKSLFHTKGNKITHTEFSKREPWLLCTTSSDNYIKLWDIRMVKETSTMPKPLIALHHGVSEKGKQKAAGKSINAAYFSLTDGCRLLATDQYDEIKVFRSPLWNLETTIKHPHRQFQHLTPIHAYWHPLEDIVIAGRYPNPKDSNYEVNELRTIDFFDAETGGLLHQHSQSGFDRIMSLNRFNHTGDALASCTGQSILIWRPSYADLERREKKRSTAEDKKRERESRDNGDGGDDLSKFLKRKKLRNDSKKTKKLKEIEDWQI